MRSAHLTLTVVLSTIASVCFANEPELSPSEGLELFERRIRPVLVERCFKCHGGDLSKPKAGLRLDTRSHLLSGGESGPAIVPGNPGDSLLIESLHYGDRSYRMPPDSKLSRATIADFEHWVRIGAPWPSDESGGSRGSSDKRARESGFTEDQRLYWSFQPVERPSAPDVDGEGWVQNDIDRFVLHRLEERGLKPAPAADRRTLLRRVTFDLIGLPPTPDEVDAFLADESPDAFLRVIDRLLASPRYGERWARHWLDGVRYVSDAGYYNFSDLGWRYRDWVVRAFQRDLPYDRFVQLQIAGDLVPSQADEDYADGVIATGVLAMGNLDDQESDRERLFANVIDDQIDLVSRQFLALTVSCARCHDHKFDPISATDYYALGGIFLSSRVLETKNRIGAPRLKIPLGRSGGGVPGETIGIQDGPHAGGRHRTIGDMRLYVRGNPFKLGPIVPRRFLRVIAGEDQVPIGERTKQSGRLELARWIASPENPLTARVQVNRIWLHHFGEGLVATPGNFGLRGERPSHPRLLDYLADELVRSGWSIKALHRVILGSATYQQSTRADDGTMKADPENTLLGRFRSRRLTAEEVFDSLLAVSGRMSRSMGQGRGNRALYARIGHTHSFRVGKLFDAPPVGTIVSRRSESTTAPQALFFLNDEAVIAASRSLADRLTRSAAAPATQIERAYRLLYGRSAKPAEVEAGMRFLSGLPPGERWTYFQVLLCANELIYLR